ncbi:MAG: zf-TFIIB domain-containing protein [Chloroflexota bacterium]
MNCPKCAYELVNKYYKGMFEVEYCPNCRGMWLDFDELDTLEDVRFRDDDLKGSLVHRAEPTGFRCPRCDQALHQFEYRLFGLKLDYCPDNSHGFWLDAGEDERVIAIMQQRAAEVQRKQDAESEWRQVLKKIKSKSFFDELFK